MESSGNLWSPDWSNAVFSLAERGARWAKVRGLMAAAGIDLLVCFPNTGNHDRLAANARYLTQLGENSDAVTVAFPIEGEITAWQSRPGVWPSSNWFTDIRSAARGTGGATLVKWIQEHPAFAKATIGIADLDWSPLAAIRSKEGDVNWRSFEVLKSAFPDARFVSATQLLGEARWRKSAEEIDFIRRGTEVAEVTLEALYRCAGPGVRERHAFGQMMAANADAGGSFPPMIGWVSGPVEKRYHRLEQPSFRTFQTGDVLVAEVEGRWGGYAGQIDQTVSFGNTPHLEDVVQYAYEAFDRALAALKPGVTISDVVAASNVTGMNGRVRAVLGGHGRGTGDDGPLLIDGERDNPLTGGLIIEEGCSLALKPSASFDGKSAYARWGETVAVTRDGAVRLGTRPKELRTLSEETHAHAR